MAALVEQYGSALMFTGTFFLAYIILRKVKNAGSLNGPLTLPPVLPALPIVGSVFHLPTFSKFHEGLLEKKKTMGGIFGFYLGSRFTLVLQGREAIHEALVKNSIEFANRSLSYLKLITNPGSNGILDRQYDATFKHIHHLSLTILKKFGFGKGIMETRINQEVEQLVAKVTELNGESFFPDPVLTVSVMNVIGTILFGQRFHDLDKERDGFSNDIYRFVRDLMKVVPINSIPALRFVPGLRSRYLELCNTHDRMMKFLNDALNNSLREVDENDAEVSFASTYRDAEGAKYDRTELLYILRDLIVAGTETSMTSLRWALIELANRPELQARLQSQIDDVIGVVDRLPSLDDRANMPLVEATLLELMRYHTVAPLSVPRDTACDVEVCGYFIPKGTMVFTSLYSVHMDPEVWSDPSVFRPERFLTDDQEQVIGRDLVLPFGTGRRSCLGELLARQELFLFVAGLLRNFDIRPPEGQEQIVYHEIQTIALAPSPFNVRLVRRSVAKSRD